MTVASEVRVQFLAKEGSRLTDREAATIGPILQGMAQDSGGMLSDTGVLAAAREKASPLHKHFEWRDKLAAEKYRLRQARDLIAAITFVVEDGGETDPPPMRFFACLPVVEDDGARHMYYVPLNVVHANPDMESEMLQIALRELRAFREKYGRLQKLDSIVNWVALQAMENELSR